LHLSDVKRSPAVARPTGSATISSSLRVTSMIRTQRATTRVATHHTAAHPRRIPTHSSWSLRVFLINAAVLPQTPRDRACACHGWQLADGWWRTSSCVAARTITTNRSSGSVGDRGVCASAARKQGGQNSVRTELRRCLGFRVDVCVCSVVPWRLLLRSDAPPSTLVYPRGSIPIWLTISKSLVLKPEHRPPSESSRSCSREPARRRATLGSVLPSKQIAD
jgi:hypothetical protein